MSYLRLLLFALLAVGVSACVSTQPRGEPSFTRAQLPIQGSARVYVLRPAFSKMSSSDSPVLSIDGKEVVKLRYDAYTDISLRPGSYRITLRPGILESSVWEGDWNITVEDGKTYFLAIWNHVDEKKGLIFIQSPVNLKANFIPWIGDVTVNKRLRYEMVAEEDALPVMAYMEYMKPNIQEFLPRP